MLHRGCPNIRSRRADRSSNLVRLHEMPGTQAVPERFHTILSALIDMIADGDVAAIRADPAIRVGAGDPLLWVRDYPDVVTALPIRVGSRRRGANRRAP